MCGIAGVVSLRGAPLPPPERLEAMCASLVHRGPDEGAVHVADGVALAIRRLAIIDVEHGHQPLFSEDRAVRAVFNGEIYNHADLGRELESRGHSLASGSDGEVLPHLVEMHGAGFVEHLNGMYAIAVHDARRRRLFLARDRIGIKPLFWSLTPDHLVFGSEVKAIFASGLVEPRMDLDALHQLLAWEYVPAPQTLAAGVRKLPPGSLLEIDPREGAVAESRYWCVAETRGNGGEKRTTDDWADEVDDLLARSVSKRLMSDVPLGAFLSGGVDSSLVVAGMGGARTFSIGFDDPSYDESRWAARVAEHLGVSHRVEILRPDVRQLFDHLMQFMDDPISDFSIFPTYLVSKLAREEVTVALTGDGGDELFGGYDTYVANELSRRYASIPGFLRRRLIEPFAAALPPRPAKKGAVNKLKRFVEGASLDERLGHARWRLFATAGELDRLLTPEARREQTTPVESHIDALAERSAGLDRIDRALFVDANSYLPDNCLVKVDRMSMACSLEARVPFLDHELVELAFHMPSRLKVDGSKTKVLLKRVAERHVPRECVRRRKEGFSIPIKNWLAGPLRPLIDDHLSMRSTNRAGIFRAERVDRLKHEHLSGRVNHSHLLWSLILAEEWRRRWS